MNDVGAQYMTQTNSNVQKRQSQHYDTASNNKPTRAAADWATQPDGAKRTIDTSITLN
jgi:hypothetical protein